MLALKREKIKYEKNCIFKCLLSTFLFKRSYICINTFQDTLGYLHYSMVSLNCSLTNEKNSWTLTLLFKVGGWLVCEILTLAFEVGIPNAHPCKQGYLLGQK